MFELGIKVIVEAILAVNLQTHLPPRNCKKPMEFALPFPSCPTFSSTFLRNGKCLQSFSNPLPSRSDPFSSSFLRKSIFSEKCLQQSMHGRGFGTVKRATSDIPQFLVEEILELSLPEPKLSYRNHLTQQNSIYTKKSRYQSTRDLRLCAEKLDELYKAHKLMLASGDSKSWKRCYKHLMTCLTGIMDVADVVVEHKNDVFNLQGFLALPLNPAATNQKILPIFVDIVKWQIKRVIIEKKRDGEFSLKKEAKKTLGRRIKVVCMGPGEMEKYLA